MKVEDIKLAFSKNQKFQLALIDDVNSFKIKANNSEDKAVKEIETANSILNKAKLSLDIASKDSLEVLQSIDKAKIMAKELGVDLPSNIEASYKYYQDSSTSYKKMQTEISKFISVINSI